VDRAEPGAVPYVRDAAEGALSMALSREQRAKNLRTGLILGSVVLAFFVGVMIKTKLLGGI
jgi:hypothetical protein